MKKILKFALVGNQNSGKTTLFNRITGSNQHTGNYPGVTVEQKNGKVRGVKDIVLVDLPGIYSLEPYSSEEKVTGSYIEREKPDCIINIVDAVNIERNLYLTIQLLELNIPMVIALNMMDEVRNSGGTIDTALMSELLGVPVIPISAMKNEGIDELILKSQNVAKMGALPLKTYVYGKKRNSDSFEKVADARYSFVESVCRKTVKKGAEDRTVQRTRRIDKVLTSKVFAIPIFLAVLFIIFWLTFDVIGAVLSDSLNLLLNCLIGILDALLQKWGIHTVIYRLIIEGICTGVGNVLGFLPIIVTLFFFLSLLEDTGYMARIAFISDRLMSRIGLSGKSIVPLIMGFGCSVPAIMSARTLSIERDRRRTVMLVPFMSCSAKIPIYTMITAMFFEKYRALIVMGLYILGVVTGVLFSIISGKAIEKGERAYFILELPNYRVPSLKNTALLMWEKSKDFLKRAFTVIFLASVVIWVLQTFDRHLILTEDSSGSILADIGRMAAPIFAPLGFGDWRAITALISGFMAKEAVISTLAVLAGSGEIGTMFTAASALSFLTFSLLYTPCIAAIAAVKKEFNSWRAALYMVIIQCQIAWLLGAAVYRLAVTFL